MKNLEKIEIVHPSLMDLGLDKSIQANSPPRPPPPPLTLGL